MSTGNDPNHDPYQDRPGESGQHPSPESINMQFIKEACILLLGVMIGFAWCEYFREVSQEAHLVVSLSIVILCMVRYIYLISRSHGEE